MFCISTEFAGQQGIQGARDEDTNGKFKGIPQEIRVVSDSQQVDKVGNCNVAESPGQPPLQVSGVVHALAPL